ncbi:MAG: hypothetical protein M3Z23_02120 [Acidobacteriota bacterium]|nr:hypothetical protein [Acidobacteriota bacterium]
MQVSAIDFAEFIALNLQSEVDLNWDLRDRSHVIATFTESSLVVEVSFERREPDAPWHVSFDVQRGESSERTHLAFYVFNGVFEAVREFLETREPEAIVFATKREGLAHIYETYLERERPALEAMGYVVGPAERIDPYVEYTVRRVKPSSWREN